uniref:Uncharacterized protein n=1 Tax=Strongyloides papillosus TaxID=174720 RepID=A0A0N5C2J6_STREA
MMDKLLISLFLLLNVITFSHSTTNPTKNVIKDVLKGIDTTTKDPEMVKFLEQLEGLSEFSNQPLVMGDNNEYEAKKSMVTERILKNIDMIKYLINENEKKLLPYLSQNFDKPIEQKDVVDIKPQWNGEDFLVQKLGEIEKIIVEGKKLSEKHKSLFEEESYGKLDIPRYKPKLAGEDLIIQGIRELTYLLTLPKSQRNGDDSLKKKLSDIAKFLSDDLRKRYAEYFKDKKVVEKFRKLSKKIRDMLQKKRIEKKGNIIIADRKSEQTFTSTTTIPPNIKVTRKC